jgi:hypothetical protein
MNQPISAEAREWAIEQIKAHGEYSSLDDLLQQAEMLAQKYVKGGENNSLTSKVEIPHGSRP